MIKEVSCYAKFCRLIVTIDRCVQNILRDWSSSDAEKSKKSKPFHSMFGYCWSAESECSTKKARKTYFFREREREINQSVLFVQNDLSFDLVD